MNKHDRLDMLKNISLFDKHDNLSIFKSYIPNHYNEIYSLYNLLIESNVNYNEINFDEPSECDDGSFEIKFNCNMDIYEKLSKVITGKKIIKYLRKNSFEVDMDIISNDNNQVNVIISFNKI